MMRRILLALGALVFLAGAGVTTYVGQILWSATDSTGTPGAATANTPSGRAKIAASASTVVITNSLVSTSSIVLAQLQASDGTCTSILRIVPASGSFTVTVNAACTAATQVGWVVIN